MVTTLDVKHVAPAPPAIADALTLLRLIQDPAAFEARLTAYAEAAARETDLCAREADVTRRTETVDQREREIAKREAALAEGEADLSRRLDLLSAATTRKPK